MEIREYLAAMAEPDFKAFTSKLLPGVDNILGVRLPKLRIMAKKIAGADWRVYLNGASESTFEETMLQGMVIGYLEEPPETVLPLVREFIPKINNWSVCDSFCSGLKIARKYPDIIWNFIQDYLKDSREFHIRFGIVMLLFYFADEDHFDEGIIAFEAVHHDAYYVKMAVAWAISIFFINLPERTLAYLMDSRLDDFTYNKALQKITESRCVEKDMKNVIRSMKR